MDADTTDGGAIPVQPLTKSALFVRQVSALVPASGCVSNNSAAALFLTGGALDVAMSLEYTANLLVGFQPVGDVANAPAGIAFQQAIVRVEDPSGVTLWGPATMAAAGFADTSPNQVTYGAMQATLLGSQLGTSLAQELQTAGRGLTRHLTSVVRVSGKIIGGSTLESEEWKFPISVCYGCLVDFPREADDLTLAQQPNCFYASPTPTDLVKPCRVGQDDLVDCRVCKETFPNNTVCEPH